MRCFKRCTQGFMIFRNVALLFAYIPVVLFAFSQSAHGLPLFLDVEADTFIRTDQNARRNDNYGKSNSIIIGTGRGGGGIPFGGPDAIRSLLRFDLTGSTALASSAILELTISGYSSSPTVYELGAYQVLELWIEGNGCEGPFSTTDGCPVDSVWVDPAFGVAWEGIDANNQTQPAFDPTVITTTFVDTSVAELGDVVQLDITSVYNSWIVGALNEGLLLRDVTSDGTFRHINFGAIEDNSLGTGNVVPNAPAARLLVTKVPEPATLALMAIGLAGLGFTRHKIKA